jgi:hypothetical protein
MEIHFLKKGALAPWLKNPLAKLPNRSIVANGTVVHKKKRQGINAVICSAGRGQNRGKIQARTVHSLERLDFSLLGGMR